MDTIGSRMRMRRRELGLSQAQLAQAAGVPQSLVSKIENGNVQRTAAVPALARALQCDPYFLDLGEEPRLEQLAAPQLALSAGGALLLLVKELSGEMPGVRAAAAELIAHALQSPDVAHELAHRLDQLTGKK